MWGRVIHELSTAHAQRIHNRINTRRGSGSRGGPVGSDPAPTSAGGNGVEMVQRDSACTRAADPHDHLGNWPANPDRVDPHATPNLPGVADEGAARNAPGGAFAFTGISGAEACFLE